MLPFGHICEFYANEDHLILKTEDFLDEICEERMRVVLSTDRDTGRCLEKRLRKWRPAGGRLEFDSSPDELDSMLSLGLRPNTIRTFFTHLVQETLALGMTSTCLLRKIGCNNQSLTNLILVEHAISKAVQGLRIIVYDLYWVDEFYVYSEALLMTHTHLKVGDEVVRLSCRP